MTIQTLNPIAAAMARAGTRIALACALVAAMPAGADVGLVEPGYVTRVEEAAALPGSPAPKHLYMFGAASRWGGPYAWRYNDTGRPAGLTRAEAIAGIDAAAGQWMNACNVSIARSASSADTMAPPQAMDASVLSPGENVIGWRDLSLGPYGNPYVCGVTILSVRAGTLVDADLTLSPIHVTDSRFLSLVAVHELGHVLGLAHSNVPAQVMSGPSGYGNPGVPPTRYESIPDLRPDDVQGCLCLYGPGPANAGKGYLCELPSYLDFGTVALGESSAAQDVSLHNDSAASITIEAIGFSTPDFRATGGCSPGTTLGPGASCTFGMAFAPVGVAGAREGMTIISAGDLGPYQFPVIGTATGTPPPNYQGLWWNAPAASESGWGISLAHQGDIIFGTWFTYDMAGAPWWLTAILRKTADGVYAGPVATFTGPAFSAQPFPAAGSPGGALKTVVGAMTATFSDRSRGTIAYTVNGVAQTKEIVPQQFGPLPTCVWGAQADPAVAANFQDMWWNPEESGWGINFTHQGGIIFATWFTYDVDGRPWFLVAQLRATSGNVYTGELRTAKGPPFYTVPWSKAQTSPAGTATVSFEDDSHATFAYTLNGVAQTKAITRMVFAPPGTICQ